VKKLVDAERKGKPLPEPEPVPEKTKVVNIMDALRSSLAQDKRPKKVAKKTLGEGCIDIRSCDYSLFVATARPRSSRSRSAWHWSI
jgi:hypothetical protein